MIDVKKSDILFKEISQPGPGCLCSRCLKPILGAPLRHLVGNNGEYRFHFGCQGHNMFYDQPIFNKNSYEQHFTESERSN